MALRSYWFSKYHTVHDSLRRDIYWAYNLRKVRCVLYKGHRDQGDDPDRNDILWFCRSD